MTAKSKTATENGAGPQLLTIPAIQIRPGTITVVGDSPLIVHKWSEKAKEMMLKKQTQAARQRKEAKDPQEDYLGSLYHLDGGGYGFPATAFKSAAISACRFVEGITMTEARGAFHVEGELVPIDGTPIPRRDMVRVGMGTADIRYRGEFTEWAATIRLVFNSRVLSPEQIVNLFNVAGFGVGVGEWRPEKQGSYGRFHVEGPTHFPGE